MYRHGLISPLPVLEIAAVHTSISLVCVLPFLPISDVSRHLLGGRIIRSISRYFALGGNFYHLRILIVLRRKGKDLDFAVHPLLSISSILPKQEYWAYSAGHVSLTLTICNPPQNIAMRDHYPLASIPLTR